jgi:hypothetical protein
MRRVRRPSLYLLALLGIALGGCVTWRPYDSTLSDGQRLPSYVRATRQDSSRVSLTGPLAGLERERVSIDRTLGVVVLLPAALLGVTWVAGCGGNNCDPVY